MRKKRTVLIGLAVVAAAGLCFLFFYKTNQEKHTSENTEYYDETMGLACFTDSGFYHTDSKNFLYFYDYESEKDVLVCTKSNCMHEEWDEETPDEQKCDGYLGDGLCAGFVWDDMLYILQTIPTEKEATLYVSDLDRSGQKVLCKTNSMNVITPFIVKNGCLYLGISQAQMEKADETIQQTDETETWMVKIDLSSGKQTSLEPKETGYNASIRLLDSTQDVVYFMRSSFEQPFTGMNFDEAGFHTQLFSYHTTTGECQLLQEKADNILLCQIMGEDLVYVKAANWGETELESYDIYKSALQTGEETLLASATETPTLMNDTVLFRTAEGYSFYDAETGKIEAIQGNVLENFRCFCDLGKYYYGVPLTDDAKPCLIQKEDLREGKQALINLTW